MKYLYLFVVLFVFSCEKPKKDSSNKEKTDKKTEVKAQAKSLNTLDKGISDPKQDLMVVLKNTSQITETKDLIKNSGLIWDKMLLDENSLKVGLIRVPADKKDFWLNRLLESGEFKNVKIYSENALNEVVKNEKNAFIVIRKTPCLGDCPTYDLIVGKDGNVTFLGKEYTTIKGKKEFKLSDKEFKSLKEIVAKSNFESLQSKYDNPEISDLQSTFFTHNGKQVQVRLWKNIPDGLINIHEYLEGILLSKKFIK